MSNASFSTVAFDVAGRRVVVVGAARSGLGAARLLAARGARVTLSDLRTQIDEAAELEALGVALELGAHEAETLRAAELIVLSPGVSPSRPDIAAARASGVPVMGELELASRFVRGRIVAVTGTKGKSTTTTLIGRMLSDAGRAVLVGGNIGVPLSAQVDASTTETIHVVETSSFQLETTATFHPSIAVWLNLTPDHLDRHANETDYIACKAKIFENQTPQDWAVVNADDPIVMEQLARVRARVMRFGFSSIAQPEVSVHDAQVVIRHGEAWLSVLPVSSVRLIGRHSLYDVLAAVSVGTLLGVEPADMRRTVEAFGGLEHALEPVGETAGVRFVNDSKATNVAAARQAIESFGPGLTVILGGRFKGGDFGDLAAPLEARGAAVVAIGESKALVRAALGGRVDVTEADTFEHAVRAAFVATKPGGVVLLAPACSSFDMFRDYAERGRAFRTEVMRLKAEVEAIREQ
jgi:UDP-N-acetylmuramoylalanine--D-glutamate ligase